MANVHMLAHLMAHFLIQADKLHLLLPVSLLETALQRRVVVVLDMVVRSAREVLRNFTPPVAIDLVQFKDSFILLGGPFNLLNVWVEMIMPPKRHAEMLMLASQLYARAVRDTVMFVTDTLALKMRNFIKNEEKRSLRNRQKVEVNGQIKNNSGNSYM